MKPPPAFDLIGVGSPIMDLLAPVSDAFLRENVAGEKGEQTLEAEQALDFVLRGAIAINREAQLVGQPCQAADVIGFAIAHLFHADDVAQIRQYRIRICFWISRAFPGIAGARFTKEW